MTNALSKLLESRPWLMADGATGTNLFAMGLEAGEAPELWCVDKPDRIRALHQGFVDAGSDIILTNSFGGTRARLKLHNAEARAAELNRVAAELARACADRAGRPVIVAGSMGPTGELLEPVGTLTHAAAVEMFEEQARGLIEGGADVLWAETIYSEEEMRAVSEAAANVGAPFCATMSFDSAGRTMMGVTSTGYADMARTLPAPPIAFGANCGVGAPDLVRTLLGLSKAAPDAVLIAKANAGVPSYQNGIIVYSGTPETMADYALLARDAGARIIGGCCGTKPEHLVAMRRALETTSPSGRRPSLEEVETRLGAFSSADDGASGAAAPARERRRRRG
ncbi:betaine--homocysteine S-methyltransferase [Pikeienuella sp. HZG-20]|uniref:betaine--homocysteine S-methyltransferase n=1 Tax=Paludibacillus litoralis TaxID=3133267 RepID=UPI0030EC9484